MLLLVAVPPDSKTADMWYDKAARTAHDSLDSSWCSKRCRAWVPSVIQCARLFSGEKGKGGTGLGAAAAARFLDRLAAAVVVVAVAVAVVAVVVLVVAVLLLAT